jgi:hypothetical protein
VLGIKSVFNGEEDEGEMTVTPDSTFPNEEELLGTSPLTPTPLATTLIAS